MGRDRTYDQRVPINGNLEGEEYNNFYEIALRDCGGNVSKLLRKIVVEYISAHSAGNDSFKLDNWNDPNFKAVPSIMDNDKEKWNKHFNDLNRDDFFHLYKILVSRKNEMLEVKKKRGLSMQHA